MIFSCFTSNPRTETLFHIKKEWKILFKLVLNCGYHDDYVDDINYAAAADDDDDDGDARMKDFNTKNNGSVRPQLLFKRLHAIFAANNRIMSLTIFLFAP